MRVALPLTLTAHLARAGPETHAAVVVNRIESHDITGKHLFSTTDFRG